MTDRHSSSATRRFATRWLTADSGELPALLAGLLLFFLLFTSYMMLRPIRETMGIAGGVDNLPWLFFATFVATLLFVPLFGLLAVRIPRAKLLPASYILAAISLAVLGAAMMLDPQDIWVGRIFYVWLSVLNLFLISVAWSVMSDVFTPAQARRLFGQIAAGASLGGLAGPLATGLLVGPVGHGGLLLISASLLLATLPCARYLVRWGESQPAALAGERSSPRHAIGGNIFAGLALIVKSRHLLGIAGFVILLASVSTFLYLEQARLVDQALPDPVRQTQLFSFVDGLVQALTIAVQLLVTGHIARRLGVGVLLVAVPVAMAFAFGLLAVAASLPLLIGVVVFRRVGEYALARPGREMLFTKVGPESRYKAKNVIDTVVYRGGDALSAWLVTLVGLASLSPFLVGIALSLAWALTGWKLGRDYGRQGEQPAPAIERAIAA